MPANPAEAGRIKPPEAKRAPLRTTNAVALVLWAASHLGGFSPEQIAAAALRGATRQPQASTSASLESQRVVRQKRPHVPTYPTQYSQSERAQVQAISQTGNHAPLPPTVRERISRSRGPDSAAIAAFRGVNEPNWGKTTDKTTGLGPKPKEEVSSGLQYGGVFENNPALATIASAGGNALWSFVDNLADFQLVSCSTSPNVVPVVPTPEPTKVVRPTPTVEIVGGDFAKSLETPTPEMRSKYNQFYEYLENIKGAMMRQLGDAALQLKPKALIPDKTTFENNLSQGQMPIVAIARADAPEKVIFAPAFWGSDLRIVSMPQGTQLLQPEGSNLKTPIIMAPIGKDGHLVSFSPGLGVFVDQKFLSSPDQAFFTTLSTLQPKIVNYAKGEFIKYDEEGKNPETNVIITPLIKDGKFIFILETKTQDVSHFAVMDKAGKTTTAPDLPGKILRQDDDGTLRYYVEGKGANAGEYFPTEQTFNLLTLQVVEPTPTPTPTVTSTPAPEATATPVIRHLLLETRPAGFELANIAHLDKSPNFAVRSYQKGFIPNEALSHMPQELRNKGDLDFIAGRLWAISIRDAYVGTDNKVHLKLEGVDITTKPPRNTDRTLDAILVGGEDEKSFYFVPTSPKEGGGFVFGPQMSLSIKELPKGVVVAVYTPMDQIDGIRDTSVGTSQNPLIIYGGEVLPSYMNYFQSF